MKRIVLGVLLGIISLGISQSQNLSEFVSDLAKNENVQRQLIDRSMVQLSIETARTMDPSGKLLEQIPPFMTRLDTIEILDLTQSAPNLKADFMKRFNSSDEEEDYEMLLSADDENDRVRIFAKKDDNITKEMIILAVDTEEEEIVVLRLKGVLNAADVEKIVDQPNQITG